MNLNETLISLKTRFILYIVIVIPIYLFLYYCTLFLNCIAASPQGAFHRHLHIRVGRKSDGPRFHP